MEDASEIGEEELLSVYLQALEYAQNADFGQAWQQLSELDSSEQGYEQFAEAIRFYAMNRDSLEGF